MAVLSIRPLPGNRGDYGKTLEQTFDYDWIAESNSRTETDYAICQYGWTNGILPIPFTTVVYGASPTLGLLCRKLTISQDKKAPLVYWVSAHYSSEPLTQAQNQPENPLDKPAEYDWRTNRYTKTIYADINNAAIVNSAGEYFDPPPEVELFFWTVQVTKNVPGIPAYILNVAEGGPVNSAAFTIQGIAVGVGIARMVEMSIGRMQTAQVGNTTVNFFPLGYTLEFREQGWQLSLLDQGLRQLDYVDNTKRIAIKDDGVPPRVVSKPWPLDGAGSKLANPLPTNCFALDFTYCFPFDFNTLPGIGTSRAKGTDYIIPNKEGDFPVPPPDAFTRPRRRRLGAAKSADRPPPPPPAGPPGPGN
jgi:hypothetical protein